MSIPASLPQPPGIDPFRPLSNGWGISPIGPSPLGGDIHDTFHVDADGNITGGHTTIRIRDGKVVELPW
jgi:hypothetical protein